MRIGFSKTANDDYKSLSPALRKAADKQFVYLAKDIRHPSLHAKKYDESMGIWQARISQSWRFYFLIHRDLYYIISIRNHPK
ncbi:hypothetical protein FJY93_00555 [Candidatus Kaiserbacteria bacterium]|nr:hypothetical protein [Candidatus Kaiserbacteria bacterium]